MASRILVAPLDWGLGHATRSVPVIEALLARGAEPVIGSAGRAAIWLKNAYPEALHLSLPAYNMQYFSANMFVNVGWQLPKLVRAVYREHRATALAVQRYGIRGIISDNRYGCFHAGLPSVLLTHQLHPRIPLPGLQGAVRHILYRMIDRFDACWVPDLPGDPGLAGALAHPACLPNVHYVGWLSHLRKTKIPSQYDLLCLLSGPEPQRTHLERLLLPQIAKLSLRALIVEGKPESRLRRHLNEKVELVGHLGSEALAQAMAASDLVICRSGYSTLMDLAKLGKRAILIPTPGQTEQEYLADQLHAAGICFQYPQKGFRISHALRAAADYRGFSRENDRVASDGLLSAAVGEFLEKI